MDQLHKDSISNADTDHDTEVMQTAARELVFAKAKLKARENDAAGDQIIDGKQMALKSALAKVSALRDKLISYPTGASAPPP